MRNAFRDAMVERAAQDKRTVFLTGDLGFNALEPVREALGDRFINTGVAEQNMVGVAAGMAHEGLRPWVYSIASFAVFRPFEQIRNDICLHNLPVVLVGNGGGFGYGVMGPTHHALEDYGTLGTLPNMRCLVPALDEDVPALVDLAMASPGPCYLRLGYDRAPKSETRPIAYAPWRCLTEGEPGGIVVAAAGPIVGLAWQWCLALRRPDISLWLASELPLSEATHDPKFLSSVAGAAGLVTIEEHVRSGSFGEALVGQLAEHGKLPEHVRILAVPRERDGSYGDQIYCLDKNGLNETAFRDALSAIWRKQENYETT